MAKEKDKKKKRKSESSMSAKEKMLARKKKLSERGRGGVVFMKEGTTRIRIKSPGENEELAIEVIQFYLGGDIGSIYSPATFDEPCALYEKYEELKSSSDEDDMLMAKRLVPKRKYIVGGLVYEDSKGKKVDKVDVPILLSSGIYTDVIELYLDEDEWGDMTAIDGYDLKVTRSGSGLNSSYQLFPCSKSKLPKEYRKDIDLEAMVRGICASYSETEEALNRFLNSVSDDDDDDDENYKKKKKSKDKEKKKKKRARDI